MKVLADILLAIAGVIFVISLIPQVHKVWRIRAAGQFSWIFLSFTAFAMLLLVTAKFLLKCYVSMCVDLTVLGLYITLIVQKGYYERDGYWFRS